VLLPLPLRPLPLLPPLPLLLHLPVLPPLRLLLLPLSRQGLMQRHARKTQAQQQQPRQQPI
jgi:hypothetical protein